MIIVLILTHKVSFSQDNLPSDLTILLLCLAPFFMSLIDGINQSEMRRRALVLFCITFLKENAKVWVQLPPVD